MASIVQFVDSIAASPTVRLDLNSASSGWMIDYEREVDISPPSLRYAIASTMLQDGDHIAASSFENRVLKLPIKLVYTATTDAAATAIQSLGRELNRPMNIVKLQLDGATSPVFFRIFRSSYAMSMLRLWLKENTTITLELPTEYAGYGLLETPVSAVTVSTDPAAVSNGCFVDVTGVKGDVEAPAIISFPGSAIGIGAQTLTAARRRGTPANLPFFVQAEAMTQGTNTTTQPNDANFSGAGNNYSRCTFASAGVLTRLSVTTLGTSGVDLRGHYRVFMRYRKNTSSDAINLHLLWGDSPSKIQNDDYVTPNNTSFMTADLGLISIPFGIDPVHGSDGVESSVSNVINIELRAERTSGSGTMDFDFLVFVPADDRLAITEWENALETQVLEARDNRVYVRDGSNRIVSGDPPHIVGGFPMLSPGQTNRIFLIRNVAVWSLTTMSSVSVSYHPRYLSVRPAST